MGITIGGFLGLQNITTISNASFLVPSYSQARREAMLLTFFSPSALSELGSEDGLSELVMITTLVLNFRRMINFEVQWLLTYCEDELDQATVGDS